MKTTIKSCFIAILSLICVYCNSSNPDSNQNIDLDKFHNLLVKINSTSELDSNKLDSLMILFKKYEKKENFKLVFPKYDDDSKLFYALINKLQQSSLNNSMYLEYIFELRFTIKRMVEWSEYLSELIHQIALENTVNFLKVYSSINENCKVIIQNDLSWLKEYDELENFITILNSIDKKEFSGSINELKNKLLL